MLEPNCCLIPALAVQISVKRADDAQQQSPCESAGFVVPSPSSLYKISPLAIISVMEPNTKPCVYCTLPEIKNREILKNDLAWAFPTNIPITPGHTLISPIRCTKTLSDLTKDERLAILDLADKIIISLKKTYEAEGLNCVWNQEKLAGQSVPHFHLHIIPRKKVTRACLVTIQEACFIGLAIESQRKKLSF